MRYSVVLLAAAMTASQICGAVACGYHPGLANAPFDVVHPQSLNVALAVRRAQEQKLLQDQPATTKMAALLGVGYRRATRDLEALGQRLGHVAPRFADGGSRGFALVLVSSRLWSDYDVKDGDATVVVHTPAANENKTVVLSDENVLHALVNEQLAFDAALELGLVQVVNDREGQALTLLKAAFGGQS
jgi:hypothetical protein